MKKTLVIITISFVLLLAGYLLYRYFFYTCCALPPKEKINSSAKVEDFQLNDPTVINTAE